MLSKEKENCLSSSCKQKMSARCRTLNSIYLLKMSHFFLISSLGLWYWKENFSISVGMLSCCQPFRDTFDSLGRYCICIQLLLQNNCSNHTKCKFYLHLRLSNFSASFYCRNFKNTFEMFLEEAFEQFVMRHTIETTDNSKKQIF